MIDGTIVVEAFLLAQMRASTLVQAAFERLRLGATELADCRDAAVRFGLGEPGHPMDVYPRLLGAPVSDNRTSHSDKYRVRTLTFVLPLWPKTKFVVSGSEEGETGGVAFSPGPLLGDLQPRLSILHPWEVVEDQIARWLQLRVVDEWYPMKDYEALIEDDAGLVRSYALHFDFGLLQEVVSVSEARPG